VRAALEKLGSPPSPIAVALSGGLDSIVLLDVLAAMKDDCGIALSALHVNHGLSDNADRWQAFCAERAASLGILFATERLDLRRERGASVEAVARAARYAALSRMARERGIGVVALAHHRDDQAETVLLQALRGASAHGLASMPSVRTDDDGIRWWRPLLDTPRRAIHAHARQRMLEWVEDESNAERKYARNRLRHDVLPVIAAAYPGYRTAFARAAERASEAAALVDQLADIDLESARCGDRMLSRAALATLDPLRARNALRRHLALARAPVPDADRLAEFVRQLAAAAQDRHPRLPLDASRHLVASGGVVRVLSPQQAAAFAVEWHAEPTVELPHGTLRFARAIGAGIAAASVPAAGLLVRSRRGGERLRFARDRPSRTLKNVLQEAGIVAPLRSGWPLIVAGTSVVAVPGVGVGVDWQCAPGEPGWTVAWEATL